MNILLIKGGWSSERDVSLMGARNVAAVLKAAGHAVTELDLAREFDSLCQQAARHDFAFIMLHGSPGEDGLVQAMLEAAGCPYQGSGPAGSFLALNKAAAKQVFRLAGIPTPDWEFLPVLPSTDWQTGLAFPIFAKSNSGGSSLGLYRAENMAQLWSALEKICQSDAAILESERKGVDLTCAVLGKMALPPVLIKPKAGVYFDFESKYQTGGADEICPAPVSENIAAKCRELALACHKALGLSGVSRTDMILDENGSLTVLETNTLPGMTATSLVPREAAAVGLDMAALLDELIRLGLEAKRGF